jgi:hypothetical protein
MSTLTSGTRAKEGTNFWSFHYLSFIKLYNNYALDIPTLELCKLHLNILFAFANNKNEKIMLKFYQLKAMDFLVNEINLEHEAHLVAIERQKIRQKDLGESDAKSSTSPANVSREGKILRSIPKLGLTEIKGKIVMSGLKIVAKGSAEVVQLQQKPAMVSNITWSLTIGSRKKEQMYKENLP